MNRVALLSYTFGPGLFTFIVQCSAVQTVYVKPGFETQELKTLKKIYLAVDPASVNSTDPENRNKILLFHSRKYVSNKTDYIVLPLKKAPGSQPEKLIQICKSNPKLDGVMLHSIGLLDMKGSKVNLEMGAGLYECKSGEKMWQAVGKKSYTMNDSDFKTLVEGDVKRFGEAARSYSAPFYLILKDLFESLPTPELTDEEKLEKIEADAL